MSWRPELELPEAPGQAWEAHKSLRPKIIGYQAVKSAAARWQPLAPLLVAVPGATMFQPVLETREFRDIAWKSALQKQRWSLLICTAWMIISFLFSLFGSDNDLWRMGLTLGLVMVFVYLDYALVTRRIDALRERSALIVWLHQKARTETPLWITLALLFGSGQLLLQKAFGGFNPMMLSIGLVYKFVHQGQWWRYITGPFLHVSLAHWMTNTIFLVAIGSISSAFSRRNAILIFLLGSIIGGIASASPWEWAPGNAFAGVSAGIFALLGWSGAAAFRRPARFPMHFGMTMTAFGILNLAMAWLLLPAASTVAHAAGWTIGIVWGYCGPFLENRGSGGDNVNTASEVPT